MCWCPCIRGRRCSSRARDDTLPRWTVSAPTGEMLVLCCFQKDSTFEMLAPIVPLPLDIARGRRGAERAYATETAFG